MQIILLLVLSSFAFAQKGASAGERCDPVEAEKECFNLLCSQTPKRLIPNDKDELVAAVKNYPYNLHPQVEKGFDSLAGLSSAIKATSRKALTEGKTQQIAEDFIKSPVQAMQYLDFLFEGDLKCVYFDGNCTVITNDLSDYPDEFVTLYRNLSESTYVFREGANLSIKDKKKLFLRALDKMEGIKSKDFIKAEKRKISRLKREFDFMTYQMDAKWLADYTNEIASQNMKFKNVLAESLDKKMNQMISMDIESDAAKTQVIQSCKIASFIKTSIDQNADYEKFELKKKKVIDNFKTKFLPKLSESSARELLGILSSDPFFLINNDINYHPYSPNLSVHRDGYVAPENSFDMMRDLSLLNQGKVYRCNLGGHLVGDSFNYGTGVISVSKFVLANGYGDVITHEMGHWLSSQIRHKNMSHSSRNKLLKVRKCIRKNYPKEKNKPQYLLQHKGDKFRTEEDFADWFAAKAGTGENGLFCDLKKLAINLGGQNSQDSYLPKAGDSHSNFLFRELNLRINRDEKIPQSCKDLMDVYPESAPQKCDL